MGIFSKLLRAGEGKKQRALAGLVPDINALESTYERMRDDELRAKTAELQAHVARSVAAEQARHQEEEDEEAIEIDPYGDPSEVKALHEEAAYRREKRKKKEQLAIDEALNDVLIDAFALVREAAKRVIGQRHYDVQLMGGAALHFGWIAEMKTGEGKTLVSTLPVFLNALSGRGVHVVTVNDYLASRDAAWMGQIHQFLGLTVGTVQPSMDFPERKAAYNCDITYGTNTEFGFDYLRDNMARSREEMVQRGHAFAIVDEVDSILIDEARTPLIISGPSSDSARLYYQFAAIVRNLKREVDYDVDEKKREVAPTAAGIERVERALNIENLYDIGQVSYVHQLTQALSAKELYHRDKEYIVRDGEVQIVDEFTGRVLEGRRWSDGLHQAVEAKERVKIQDENHTWATVTLQNYFRMYDKIAGMTGTAETEAAEFANTYNMMVVPIPTNRELLRADQSDLIYRSELGKFNAIVEDVQERSIEGQPVLIGTASVEKSELLSNLLTRKGIKHEVLNAKQHAREAEIVAQAGRIGAVTVATNMAGRGVDILLGGNPEGLAARETIASGYDLQAEDGQAFYRQTLETFKRRCASEGEEVRKLGGLYVLGSERHESRRIDNQLRGRSGRQGDPGESRFYLSLEDELMRLFATGAINWMMERGLPEDIPITARPITKAIENAQRTVEARNAEIRKDVLKYDAVMNEQRKVIYALRNQVIDGEDMRAHTVELLHAMVETVVDSYTDEHVAEWDPQGLVSELNQYYPTRLRAEDLERLPDAEDLIEVITKDVDAFYAHKERSMPGGEGTMRALEREAMLRIIDQKWRDHLAEMDYLREGINLRAMGQQDPLVAWQREGFLMFDRLVAAIDDDYLKHITRIEVVIDQPETQRQQLAQAQFSAASDPVQGIQGVANAAQGGQGMGASAADPEAVQPVVRSEQDRIGRNDPCYCGSGKKYKACHGR